MNLKSATADARVLMAPKHDKPFYIVTDASDYAVGCSLEQIDTVSGTRRPIRYLSHTINSAERSYPTHERELLAIVIALQFLLGSEFSVISQTDHRPLHSFLSQTTLSARQVRWQQFLSELNLKVAYLPGKANVFADGLSLFKLRAVAALAPYDNWLTRISSAVDACPVASGLKRTALNLDPKSEADAYIVYPRYNDTRYNDNRATTTLNLHDRFIPLKILSILRHHDTYITTRSDPPQVNVSKWEVP
jgi:hypothetical protein